MARSTRKPRPLVLEWHYTDGDVGAYGEHEIEPLEVEAARLLWAGFAQPRKGHTPTRVVIRFANPDEVP